MASALAGFLQICWHANGAKSCVAALRSLEGLGAMTITAMWPAGSFMMKETKQYPLRLARPRVTVRSKPMDVPQRRWTWVTVASDTLDARRRRSFGVRLAVLATTFGATSHLRESGSSFKAFSNNPLVGNCGNECPLATRVDARVWRTLRCGCSAS